MNRLLSVNFVQKSYRTLFGIVVFSAAMCLLGGCGKIAGEKAYAEKNGPENQNAYRSKTGKVVPEIVGRWQKKPAGGEVDYASYAENLGSFESYEITENGRIRRTGLAAAKNYDCLVETSTANEGAIIVETDSDLNITLDVGTVQHKNSCSAEKNYINSTKATTADFKWKIGKDASGAPELCLTPSSGEMTCYRRVE